MPVRVRRAWPTSIAVAMVAMPIRAQGGPTPDGPAQDGPAPPETAAPVEPAPAAPATPTTAPAPAAPVASPPPSGPPPPQQVDPHARTHDGFYFRVGGTLGRAWVSYDAPMNTGVRHHGTGAGGGIGFDLAMGGTLPGGLVLGGMFFIHYPSFDFDDERVMHGWDRSSTAVGGIGAFARFYPWPKKGFHLEASLGYVRHQTEHTVTNYTPPLTCPWVFPTCFSGETRTITVVERSYGWELGGGAGWGFWVGDKWSFDLTGRFQVAHTFRGDNEYWFYMPTLGLGMTAN